MKLASVLFIVLQVCVSLLFTSVMLSRDDGQDFSLVGVAILVAYIGVCIAAFFEGMTDTPDRRRFVFCLVGPLTIGMTTLAILFVEWLSKPSVTTTSIVAAVTLAPAMVIYAACFLFAPTWAFIGIGALVRGRSRQRANSLG
jgi:hypothetical protein